MDSVRYTQSLHCQLAVGRIKVPAVVGVVHRNCYGCAHRKIVVIGATNDFEGRDLFVLAPGKIVNCPHCLILKRIITATTFKVNSHYWTRNRLKAALDAPTSANYKGLTRNSFEHNSCTHTVAWIRWWGCFIVSYWRDQFVILQVVIVPVIAAPITQSWGTTNIWPVVAIKAIGLWHSHKKTYSPALAIKVVI